MARSNSTIVPSASKQSTAIVPSDQSAGEAVASGDKPDWKAIQQRSKRISKKLTETASPEELSTWQLIAIAKHELTGETYKSIADEMRGGKGAETMRKASQSPAGKEWRAQVRQMVQEDPMSLFQHLVRSDLIEAIMDHQLARQWAREARNADLLHRMTKDVTLKYFMDERSAQHKKDEAPTVIQVNVGYSGALETEELEVEYEVVDTGDTEEST